jgi:hypothetical protein
MLAGVEAEIPLVVRMRVECAGCGHAEDDTYEFDLPPAQGAAEGGMRVRQVPRVRFSDSDAPDADAAGAVVAPG